MKTTLVVMAAGIGSRYGGGIKQLEAVGPSGEIIMDYSIQDAIDAGFDDVVFIIRKSLEEDFRAIIGERIERLLPVRYVFQEVDDVPEYIDINDRTKPWGTVQALLTCKNVVKNPFVVINADDYYGKEAFVKVHDFLVDVDLKAEPMRACMAGFLLKNTMSDNGGVNRGICTVDEDGYLLDVVETNDIVCENDIAVGFVDGNKVDIDLSSYVSMNFWGFTPQIFEELNNHWLTFLDEWNKEDIKAEYLLPTCVGTLLNEHKINVRVLETNDNWFGVTYKEDKPVVIASFKELIEKGIYKSPLNKSIN